VANRKDVRFGEAYELGGVGEEELATTLGGGADALSECFSPKPSPKPSPRPRTMATTTAMPPISRHGHRLFLPFFPPLADDSAKEIFCSAIGRPQNAVGLSWSAGGRQRLCKKSKPPEIAHLHSGKRKSCAYLDNLVP
jgi:hypothetical protein